MAAFTGGVGAVAGPGDFLMHRAHVEDHAALLRHHAPQGFAGALGSAIRLCPAEEKSKLRASLKPKAAIPRSRAAGTPRRADRAEFAAHVHVKQGLRPEPTTHNR